MFSSTIMSNDITYYEVRKNGVVLATQSGLDKQTIREMRKAGYSVKEVKKDADVRDPDSKRRR